jgi:hypothetical protein
MEAVSAAEVVDLRLLDQFKGCDLRQLVDSLADELTTLHTRLEAAIDDGCHVAVDAAVHAIKGIACNMGARRVPTLCRAIHERRDTLRGGSDQAGWLDAARTLRVETQRFVELVQPRARDVRE